MVAPAKKPWDWMKHPNAQAGPAGIPLDLGLFATQVVANHAISRKRESAECMIVARNQDGTDMAMKITVVVEPTDVPTSNPYGGE